MGKISGHEIAERMGGRFKLTFLLQKRYKELMFGSRPLVDVDSEDVLDVLLAEVAEDKIELVPEAEAVAAAAAALLGDTPKKTESAEASEAEEEEGDGEE